jgi:hypothetical protein
MWPILESGSEWITTLCSKPSLTNARIYINEDNVNNHCIEYETHHPVAGPRKPDLEPVPTKMWSILESDREWIVVL